MQPQLDRLVIDFSTKKLKLYVSRIRECLGRLTEEQIWARHSENENAIGNLMLHLAGNVRQWIVSGAGGQPDTRKRDQEFAARGNVSSADMLAHLEATVAEANEVLVTLSAERLAEIVQIQGNQLPVIEAVSHVVVHFAEHTGQIQFATKLLTGQDLGFFAYLNKPAHNEKTP